MKKILIPNTLLALTVSFSCFASAEIGYEAGSSRFMTPSFEKYSTIRLNVKLGYMFDENLGVEVVYSILPSNEFASGLQSTPTLYVKPKSTKILATSEIPLAPRWTSSVKAGIGYEYLHSEIRNINGQALVSMHESRVYPTTVVGVHYHATEHLFLSSQLHYDGRSDYKMKDNATLTLGFNYRFGKIS